MKKTLLVLMTFLSCSIVCAEESSPMNNSEDVVVKSLQATDEYEQLYDDEEEDQLSTQDENVVSEYEQHVCDNVKPPKPSSISAILTNIGCTILVQYIYLTEKAKVCLAALKQSIAKWLKVNE